MNNGKEYCQIILEMEWVYTNSSFNIRNQIYKINKSYVRISINQNINILIDEE